MAITSRNFRLWQNVFGLEVGSTSLQVCPTAPLAAVGGAFFLVAYRSLRSREVAICRGRAKLLQALRIAVSALLASDTAELRSTPAYSLAD